MMGVQVMHVEYSTSTAAVGSDKIPRATATGDKTTTATESNSISTVPPIPTPVVCDKIPRATAIGDKTTTATESNSISTAPPIPTPVPTHTHTHTPNTHTLTHTAHAGGRNANDDSGAAALFEPGARVRVRLSTSQPLVRRPHLRTPGYIHGCAGVVERYLGMFHDPSFLAWRGYKQQQHLYRVRFIRKDIWVGTGVLPESRAGQGAAGRGDGGDLLDSVDVEIYESWLEPALAPAAGTGTDTDTDTGTGTGTADTGTRVGRDSGGSSTLTHDHEHSHSSHAPATAATVATVATAATVHDHSHAHTHDHGGEHIHEDRSTVEQNALDKEQEDTLGKYIAEVLIEQCIKRQVVTPLELTQALEKVDMLGSKSEGPRIVARAWSDPEFKKRLLIDANMALAELGIAGSNNTASTKLVVLENTRDTHNVIVCTLCSCYPLSILGLSPPWYKVRTCICVGAGVGMGLVGCVCMYVWLTLTPLTPLAPWCQSRAYRARLVRAPRSVLAEFGTVLKAHVKVNVHDSTADCRYIVLPVRPERTAG